MGWSGGGGGSSGGGTVDSVVPGDGIDVDDTDPANPVVSTTATTLTVPAGTQGLEGGLIGLEYDGAPYALGAVIFDTVYLDPTTTDSDPLTVPVVGDFCTFETTGITDVETGLYQVQVTLSTDIPFTLPFTVFVAAGIGTGVGFPYPAGKPEPNFQLTMPVRAGGSGIQVFVTADPGELAQITYAALGIAQLAPLTAS